MPSYIYECEFCGKKSEIFHNMSEPPGPCPTCGEEGLKRVYASRAKQNKATKSRERKTGQIVEEFISNAREDLKRQTNDLKGRKK